MASTSRHRRTASIPLKVRTTLADSVQESSVLSPSNAELPSAIPEIEHLQLGRRNDGASVHVTTAALPAKASEKYGFVVYVGSLVAWWIYLFWGFVPDRYLRAIGVEWYPDRQWAYLIPCWIMAAVVFVYVGYFALNLYHTPPLDNLTCLVDTQGHLLPRAERDSSGKITKYPAYSVHTAKGRAGDYIPPLYDLPAGMVNEALFGND